MCTQKIVKYTLLRTKVLYLVDLIAAVNCQYVSHSGTDCSVPRLYGKYMQ